MPSQCTWCEKHGEWSLFSQGHLRVCRFYRCNSCQICDANKFGSKLCSKCSNHGISARATPRHTATCRYSACACPHCRVGAICVFCKFHGFQEYDVGQHAKFCKFRSRCSCGLCIGERRRQGLDKKENPAKEQPSTQGSRQQKVQSEKQSPAQHEEVHAKGRVTDFCVFCKLHGAEVFDIGQHAKFCKFRSRCSCGLCIGERRRQGLDKQETPANEQKTQIEKQTPGQLDQKYAKQSKTVENPSSLQSKTEDGLVGTKISTIPSTKSNVQCEEQTRKRKASASVSSDPKRARTNLDNCLYCLNHNWHFPMKSHHRDVCMYRLCRCTDCRRVRADLKARLQRTPQVETAVAPPKKPLAVVPPKPRVSSTKTAVPPVPSTSSAPGNTPEKPNRSDEPDPPLNSIETTPGDRPCNLEPPVKSDVPAPPLKTEETGETSVETEKVNETQPASFVSSDEAKCNETGAKSAPGLQIVEELVVDKAMADMQCVDDNSNDGVTVFLNGGDFAVVDEVGEDSTGDETDLAVSSSSSLKIDKLKQTDSETKVVDPGPKTNCKVLSTLDLNKIDESNNIDEHIAPEVLPNLAISRETEYLGDNVLGPEVCSDSVCTSKNTACDSPITQSHNSEDVAVDSLPDDIGKDVEDLDAPAPDAPSLLNCCIERKQMQDDTEITQNTLVSTPDGSACEGVGKERTSEEECDLNSSLSEPKSSIPLINSKTGECVNDTSNSHNVTVGANSSESTSTSDQAFLESEVAADTVRHQNFDVHQNSRTEQESKDIDSTSILNAVEIPDVDPSTKGKGCLLNEGKQQTPAKETEIDTPNIITEEIGKETPSNESSKNSEGNETEQVLPTPPEEPSKDASKSPSSDADICRSLLDELAEFGKNLKPYERYPRSASLGNIFSNFQEQPSVRKEHRRSFSAAVPDAVERQIQSETLPEIVSASCKGQDNDPHPPTSGDSSSAGQDIRPLTNQNCKDKDHHQLTSGDSCSAAVQDLRPSINQGCKDKDPHQVMSGDSCSAAVQDLRPLTNQGCKDKDPHPQTSGDSSEEDLHPLTNGDSSEQALNPPTNADCKEKDPHPITNEGLACSKKDSILLQNGDLPGAVKNTHPQTETGQIVELPGTNAESGSLVCVVCGKTFGTLLQLRMHSHIQHQCDPESDDEVRLCRVCSFETTNQVALSDHENAHMGLLSYEKLFLMVKQVDNFISFTNKSNRAERT